VAGIPPERQASSGSASDLDSTAQALDNESTPVPRTLQRIVLTGFMGAGKSTIGRLLAQRLGWRFVDVDDAIEAAQEATIAAIFAKNGESWFRQLEHETIQRLLGSDRLVLALGGGAIEDDRTRNLLLQKAETRLVHLHVSLDTVLLRCRGTEDLRPILQDQANLENRYKRRLPLYREAHLTIAADSLLPEAIVSAILAEVETV
jgi:shikimate kinase